MSCRQLDRCVALHFRDEFRQARLDALKNAEGYQGVLFVLERLGSYLHPKGRSLSHYEKCVASLVKDHHPLDGQLHRDYHIRFCRLYEMVRVGRNDALHQGAVARTLTTHSVELSMMIEDALMNINEHGASIRDYMVRNPVCAHPWQPISFIRQTMLENSFSHLPFRMNASWYLISDIDIAKFRWESDGNHDRMKETLDGVIDEIDPMPVAPVPPGATVHQALESAKCRGWPILVANQATDELLGIVTPYDLM